MDRVAKIREITKHLYEKSNPVISWNHWIFEGHNEVVVKWVEKIAETQKFNLEFVKIAAYLHDLAYAWTDKNDPTCEQQSEDRAREILERERFTQEEIKIIVDQIIKGHGMHDGKEPDLIEAKVLATADAMAHFTTDFYLVVCWNRYLFEKKSLSEYKAWVLKKMKRDFENKIFFEECRHVANPYYNALKTIFSL